MTTFPSLEPFSREYTFGAFAVDEEVSITGGMLRYRFGDGISEEVSQQLTLIYQYLPEADLQLIRDHHIIQQGGTLAFNLPAVIWQGHTSDVFPADVQWRYVEPPTETHRSGDQYDVSVTLESVLL